MLPNIKHGTVVLENSCTEYTLSSTQCDVSPLDLNTVSLSLMDLSTVTDCPEDSVYHNLFIV